jgi:hypothetical protein
LRCFAAPSSTAGKYCFRSSDVPTILHCSLLWNFLIGINKLRNICIVQ